MGNPRFSKWRVFRTLLIVYGIVLLLAYFFADRLIFLPHTSSYRDDPGRIIKLTTGDGVKISAASFPVATARYTVLFSHGNGEDIGNDTPFFQDYNAHGFSVFAYDYHGYGTSGGHPSEQKAYADVNAAYDYLTRVLKIPASRIIAHGRSLGGGVAVDLASRRPVAGLIMESTFTTTFRVRTHFAIVPFDEFRSIDKIAKVHCPVMVIHGTADGMIGIWHAKALYERANQPKSFLWVEGAGHGECADVGGEDYWRNVETFARSLGP